VRTKLVAIDRGAERSRGWGSAKGAKGHPDFNEEKKGKEERAARSFLTAYHGVGSKIPLFTINGNKPLFHFMV
jgi:hypothetical protein